LESECPTFYQNVDAVIKKEIPDEKAINKCNV
jgi:hypothetical protein